MDIKFILNDVLNKALINKGRIKGIPSSDKIGEFVNKYIESEQLLIQRVSKSVNCEHIRGSIIERNNEWLIECRKCRELY